MATIGNTTQGGFFEAFSSALRVLAQKFTAPSTFSPIQFNFKFGESWGVGGTMYVAIYADNAGVPGAKLWDGSVAYSSRASGIKQITIDSPPELTSSTDYWLCAYAKNTSGGFLVSASSTASISGQQMKTWTELVEGSWTDDPSVSNTGSANETMVIYATDEIDVTDERDAKVSGIDTIESERDAKVTGTGDVNSERDAHLIGQTTDASERDSAVFGGDGRYVEHFSDTDYKDVANTTANWTGDGEAEMKTTIS